jgi:metal-responsive CopG/Arc/MetJ family transcriptional regulator
MRTLIDIPDDQIAALAEIGREAKKSRAALVRDMIAHGIAQYTQARHEAALEAAFGIWKDKVEDGLEYQRRLRAEWDDIDHRIDERLGRNE